MKYYIVCIILILSCSTSATEPKKNETPNISLNDSIIVKDLSQYQIDSTKLKSSLEWLQSMETSGVEVWAYQVYRNDSLLLDFNNVKKYSQSQHFKDQTVFQNGEYLFNGMSMTKSATGLVFLNAMANQHIDPNKIYLKDIMPIGWEQDNEHLNTLTLNHFFGMKSGLKDIDSFRNGGNWYDVLKTSEIVYQGGTKFFYSSSAISLMAYVFYQKTGFTLHEYANNHLFNALNINNSYWYGFKESETNRVSDGASGLYLSLNDWSKLSSIYLRSTFDENGETISEGNLEFGLQPILVPEQGKTDTIKHYTNGFVWNKLIDLPDEKKNLKDFDGDGINDSSVRVKIWTGKYGKYSFLIKEFGINVVLFTYHNLEHIDIQKPLTKLIFSAVNDF